MITLFSVALAAEPCTAGVCALTLWHPDHQTGEIREPRERFELGEASPWVDLGDSWSDAELAFDLAPGVAITRVEAQVSFGLSLAAEGPHLDLVDLHPVWTARFPAVPASDGRFALEVPGMPADPGFRASPREVRRAIRAEVRTLWAPEHVAEETRFWTAIAAGCPDWRSGACSVSESRLRLFVTTTAGSRTIDVVIPQGC